MVEREKGETSQTSDNTERSGADQPPHVPSDARNRGQGGATPGPSLDTHLS